MESSGKEVERKKPTKVIIFNNFFRNSIANSSVGIARERKVDSAEREKTPLYNVAENKSIPYSKRHLESSRIHKDDLCKNVNTGNSDLENQSEFKDLKRESRLEVKPSNSRKRSYIERKHSFQSKSYNEDEDYKKECFNGRENKHIPSTNTYSRLHKDKSHKSAYNGNTRFENYSDFQKSRYDTRTRNDKKQNYSARKNSRELEADIQNQESEDCIEYSGMKHERVISNIDKFSHNFKVSFKNDSISPPPNTSPTMPAYNLSPFLVSNTESAVSHQPTKSLVSSHTTESSVSSLPTKSPISHLSTSLSISRSPTELSFSSQLTGSSVSCLPTGSSVSRLPTQSSVFIQPTKSLITNLPSALSSSLPKKFPAPCLPAESPISGLHSACLSAPSVISYNSNLTVCNKYNAHIFLSSEEECFIPPPVIPPTPTINSSDGTGLERNGTFPPHNSLESTLESCLDECETDIPILDPEHLKAISDYISTVVEERKVSPSSATKVERELNLLFKDHFEGNVIELYGSYESELAISTSDINLVVIADISIRKSFMYEVYKTLSSELEKYHVLPFEEKNSVHKTKVNFSHPDTGVSCQLAYLGRYKANIFKMGNFLKKMCSFDDRVKTLIIATKIWAEYLAINEIEDGKLHPIGYVLLVIHFLQQCENPILPLLNDQFADMKANKNTLSVGELWLAFLRYYSVSFNWKQNVATVNSKEIVSKKSKDWGNYWMAIEDPFTEKNIAESVVNSDIADYIKACFKSSYAYFCSSPETSSVSSSTGEGQNNGESSGCKYEFSFQQCVVEQSDAFCETCEDINDVCDDCKTKIYVQPMDSVPKMTDSFVLIVKEALMTIYNKYILSEEEINERKLFVQKLQKEVRRVYPDAELNLFGSSTNGFGFKKSDLDICVTLKKKQINSIGVLKDIRFLLRKDKSFKHVIAIFGAQIPIIKFHYEPKRWRGDISLDNTLAVHNSELLHTYSLIDERCKILGCALKLLAKKALVAEVTEKALSSYSYLNMVIHFLQQIEPPVLPFLQDNKFRGNNFKLDHIVENCNVWFCNDLEYIKKVFKRENVTSVEQLWLNLLDYYCSFDSNQFISIRQKETQHINGLRHSARLFNIQDPFIETKNLGCVVSAKKAEETKSVLNRARCLFRTPVKELPSSVKDVEDYFFSTMSLTGRIHKEAHCDLCGKFGHEQKDCKQSCFPLRRPNFGRFQKYNLYNKRIVAPYKQPMRPLFRKQFSL